jgi:hypothetical protein
MLRILKVIVTGKASGSVYFLDMYLRFLPDDGRIKAETCS